MGAGSVGPPGAEPQDADIQCVGHEHMTIPVDGNAIEKIEATRIKTAVSLSGGLCHAVRELRNACGAQKRSGVCEYPKVVGSR